MKNDNSKGLTKSQLATYQKLYNVIKAGAATFMEVGMALVTMHKERLYREEFATFEEFAKSCGISRAHAYRSMGAVQMTLQSEFVSLGDKENAESLGNIDKNLLASLSIKAREELGKYPSDKQDEILLAAAVNGTPNEIEIAAAAVSISIGRKQPRKPKASVTVAQEIEEDRTNANAAELDRRLKDAALPNPVLPTTIEVAMPSAAPNQPATSNTIATVDDALAFCRTTDQQGGDWETAAMILAPEISRMKDALRQATANVESLMAKSDPLAGKKTITPDQLLSELNKFKRFIPDDMPQNQREKYGAKINEFVKWLMNPVKTKAFSAYTN